MSHSQRLALSSTTTGTTTVGSSHPQALLALVLLLVAGGAGLGVVVGPPNPAGLPGPQAWRDLDVLAGSANPPVDGVVQLAILVAWLVWVWAVASVTVELALRVADQVYTLSFEYRNAWSPCTLTWSLREETNNPEV